uniref:CUB domain-containing protein n=1 Tax=Steinernema glaseri TaxID=37863 RepID=A0A1I7Y5T5_9BILA
MCPILIASLCREKEGVTRSGLGTSRKRVNGKGKRSWTNPCFPPEIYWQGSGLWFKRRSGKSSTQALSGVEARCECLNRIVMLLKEKDYRALFSPDYPRYYCPNLDCTWRVVAPDNSSSVHFFTDNLDLRPNEDFLYFYDHDAKFSLDMQDRNFTHRCSGDKVCQFKSAGQYATIRFVSGDGYPQNYGFQGTVALFDRSVRPAWASSLSGTVLIAAMSCVLLLVVALVVFCTCLRGGKPKASHLSKEEAVAEEKLLQS